VLMTLGNEIIVADGMKEDFKQEIHESVNRASELQVKVSQLEAQKEALQIQIDASDQEKFALTKRHEELSYSIQEELLQTRIENEDLLEETESLRHQLRGRLTGMDMNGIDSDGGRGGRGGGIGKSADGGWQEGKSGSPSEGEPGNMRLPSSSASTAAAVASHAHYTSTLRTALSHSLDSIELLGTSSGAGATPSNPDELRRRLRVQEQLNIELIEKLHRAEARARTLSGTALDSGSRSRSRSQSPVPGVGGGGGGRENASDTDGRSAVGSSRHHQHQQHHSSSSRSRSRSNSPTNVRSHQAHTQEVIQLEAQILEYKTINEVQQQLLKQKDFQISQLKDSQSMHGQLHSLRETQLQQQQQGGGLHYTYEEFKSSSGGEEEGERFGGGAGGGGAGEDEVSVLRRQLAGMHRALDEARSLGGPQSESQSQLQHPGFMSIAGAGSESVSGSGSVGGNGMSQQQQFSQQQHPSGGSVSTQSTVTMGSSMQPGSTVGSTYRGVGSSVGGGGHAHVYAGDLQYISTLEAILEENSMHSGSRSHTHQQGTSPRGGGGGVGSGLLSGPPGVSNSMHTGVQSTGYTHGMAGGGSSMVGGGISQAGIPSGAVGVIGASGADSLNNGATHEVHHPHPSYPYANQQQQQQHDMDAINEHLASVTAANVALTARTNQLEQRLRHSELRCKLLMDQIKSMPVSLSVAQVKLISFVLHVGLVCFALKCRPPVRILFGICKKTFAFNLLGFGLFY
jgi:hypothetical protein